MGNERKRERILRWKWNKKQVIRVCMCVFVVTGELIAQWLLWFTPSSAHSSAANYLELFLEYSGYTISNLTIIAYSNASYF